MASTSADVTGYHVYRAKSSSGPFERLDMYTVSQTTYTDTTVQSATTYYYTVTAEDSEGHESDYSDVVEAVVP